MLALRTGDVAALREHLGKGPGLAARARELATKLDTEAWLVAMGAVEREYDLPHAVAAMQADNDTELADALGFGQQALQQDVLNGGGSVYIRRANARKYYQSGAQPIALLDDVEFPLLPAGCMAMHVTLWGRLNGRELRVRYGLGVSGATNLEADAELGRTEISPPSGAQRYQDAADALPRVGPAATFNVAGLANERWYGAQFILLAPDGTIQNVLMGRDDGGWGIVEQKLTARQTRLGELRDQRMNVIRRRAADMLRSAGLWPRKLDDVNLQARELCDPTVDPWAEFAIDPIPGFEVAADPNGIWQVAATAITPKGRRAITPTGAFIWID